MKRAWWIVLVLIGVAGAAWIVHARSSRPPEPKYVTVAAEKGRLVARVTATGTLSALVTVQVGSQVSGRISDIFVDFNSPVKKGQVIAKIDSQLFVAAVEQARANYLAAVSQLTKAKVQSIDSGRQFERSKALRDQKLIAQADLDTAQATADAAKANVDAADSAVAQARASLHQSEINLQYTTIISPTNGVVISRAIDVGQTVAASFQSPTLFTIAEDLKKMQVDTSVAEADVGKLKSDMPSTFTVDAYPTERFKGKVRQIRNAPQTVQNVVTYDAVIDVDNTELKLKPGMTANVTFVYAEVPEALKVPNAALRFRPPASAMRTDGGTRGPGKGLAGGKRSHDQPPDQRTVYVLRDGNPQQVMIRIGVSDGSITEVVDGPLAAGDLVITEALGDKPGAPAASPFRGGRPF